MGSKFSSGFTIIELMLFLAITGLLIAGILVNAAGSLNDQHYRDGVEATKSSISAQYAKVYSLTNDSAIGGVANIDPCQVLEGNTSSTVRRGTSNCLYVGRLIQVIPGSTASTLKISPVIAKPNEAYNPARVYQNQQSGAGSANSSTSAFADRYRVARYEGNGALVENKELEWGLAAVAPGSDTQVNVALLVLRSPIDGTVQTYNLLATNPGAIDYTNLSSRLTTENLSDVKFCVADLTGSMDPSQRMAVLVHKAATGPSDVETRLNNPENEGGGAAC